MAGFEMNRAAIEGGSEAHMDSRTRHPGLGVSGIRPGACDPQPPSGAVDANCVDANGDSI
jgi:hypothetical protein